jgi:hypothetical protein
MPGRTAGEHFVVTGTNGLGARACHRRLFVALIAMHPKEVIELSTP